ncbi:B56 [Murid betaherpesvirus 8]|uniref:B56 n=2 Tax=Rat cytomegalovirus (isolate England) TaxID=1261657 RepID=K7XXW9_RCMVE|nr:E56 [Murid betaherpesvirus 8]AKE44233.1 a56 [Rat cytomegalovirus ALL-03]AFX83380.1 E56 [Murid betaherpesvirus 8]AKB93260.1 B56 [Murid betaherpesvirus 8]WEG71853.1 DNA packaging terminase subunit 2 [Murid betaherpesvirus 8]WPH24975.1 B56 [Murid betaherpesvirus 8]
MNTLQKLCVVCSKCNECAMDAECLKYCDPNIVLMDSTAFKKNGLMVIHLYRTLYPALVNQNTVQTSVLTLYMQMLLQGLYDTMREIDMALMDYATHQNRETYFRRVLKLDACHRHESVQIVFAPELELTIDLSTLNDVERLLCKINCVYGAVEANQGVAVCRQLLSLLAKLCDICPVASPEVYRETATCFQCYEELMVVPNQGRSINRRMQGLLCDHVTIKRPLVQLDMDAQTVEQDMGEIAIRAPNVKGVIRAIKTLASSSQASYAYINDAEETLKGYNLFSDIPDPIYSLSDYTYWSKTSEAIVKHVGVTMRQLNVSHNLWKTLRMELSRYLYGEDIEDLFSLGEDRFGGDERIYVGSIFAAPGRVVDMITSMSIKSFESNPLFNKLHESNEIYAKIKSLIEEIRGSGDGSEGTGARGGVEAAGGRGDGGGAVKDGTGAVGSFALECGDPLLRTHDVNKEVNVRKRAYLKKVSEMGYNKVMACIRNQEHLVTKLINVNLVGTVCLEALSKVMNGFLCRQRCAKDALDIHDVSVGLGYDEHLYIMNNLAHKKLPYELLPQLGQQIYRFINGPMFTHYLDRHPLPYNVNMAYACDNAGVLPHVKEDLVRCADGNAVPGEWMVVGYMGFFKFSDVKDLNDLQKMLWAHVRELVLSVALYNETFGKRLSVCRVEDGDDESDGLILTYNQEAPLLLRCRGRVFKSKDLYLLLYKHLSLDSGVLSGGSAPCVKSSVRTEPVAVGIDGKKRRKISLIELVRDVDGVGDGDLVPGCLYE